MGAVIERCDNMNINELSDSTASVTIADIKKQKSKKFKIMIGSVIVILLVAVLIIGYYLHHSQNYKKYVDGIISNDKLELDVDEGGTKLYNYSDPISGIKYVTTHNSVDKRIQTQALQSVTVDEKLELINNHFLNLIYNYSYESGGEPVYTVNIHELVPPKNSEDLYDVSVYVGARITPKLELIGCSGDKDDGKTELTDAEAREVFEKYREEIAELLQKMYDFFGEEHFKK